MAEEKIPGDLAGTTVQTIRETTEAVKEGTSHLSRLIRSKVDDVPWIPEGLVDAVTYGVLLAAFALVVWILFVIARPLILKLVKKISERTTTKIDDHLLGHGVFTWLTHLLTGLFVYSLAPGLFEGAPTLAYLLKTGSSIYLLLAGYLLIDSLLNASVDYISKLPGTKRLNLGTFVQVAKLVFALIAIILGLAVLIGKSPTVLLGGLGVFASVLMLVFKDVILGFVAGVQLGSNQMVSIGDWIEMPSQGADGDVEEIGLTTVKVRNFDNTVTTVPTYALISQSFKNWRGMQESEGRRIKRSIIVDTNSIQLCTPEMLDRFRQIEHIAEHLKKKELEIEEWNSKASKDFEVNRVNGRRLTNVGTFRAYIELYLRNHEGINQELTLLVRQLASEGSGLPIQIYCFTKNKAWGAYEEIQADIFDHLFAVAAEFDLRLFQQPTGLDFRNLGEDQS